jgi:hypothetical protein
VSPVEWSPCCLRTIHLPLTASPCGRLSRPRSTISQYDFHSVVGLSSPWRLVGSYKLSFEPDGSPLFTSMPLVACWRYEPREHRLLRSRSISGLFSRSLHSGLQPPCLRFATAVTGRHARLGSWPLARLCHGPLRHRRWQTSTRLQGATPVRTGPYTAVREVALTRLEQGWQAERFEVCI